MDPIRGTVRLQAGQPHERKVFPMQNSTLAKIALTAAVAVGGVGFFVKSTSDSRAALQDGRRADGERSRRSGRTRSSRSTAGCSAGSIDEEVVNQETQPDLRPAEGAARRSACSARDPSPTRSRISRRSSRPAASCRRRIEARRSPKSLGVDASRPTSTYVVEANELHGEVPLEVRRRAASTKTSTRNFEVRT